MTVMKEKYIELLQKQLDKLDNKDFDFDAWKASSIIILSRIFGATDIVVKNLRELKVDYGSSWSMRAVSGSFNPIESAKKHCREILSTALDEIQYLGLNHLNANEQLLKKGFEDTLTVKEYKKLKNLMEDEKSSDKAWQEFFRKYKKEDLVEVIKAMLR